MTETKWVDWQPKVGDVRPEVYRWRESGTVEWKPAMFRGEINAAEVASNEYQIPAPKETSMKYWQPRVEPMTKGWSLADVPDDVKCESQCGSCVSWIASRQGNSVVAHYSEDSFTDDLNPNQCRVIRVIDQLPAGAMTLDRVPEGVRCVCQEGKSDCIVRVRSGDYACSTEGHQFFRARDYQVLHILDPLPELSVTLDTLPVGRVIEWNGQKVFYAGSYWRSWNEDGSMPGIHGPVAGESFTVTDIIMELKEVV